MKKIKLFGIGILILLISMNIIAFGLSAEDSIIIGDDPIGDHRIFDNSWLNDELDDTEWEDLSGLNDVYNTLCKNWDNPECSEKPTKDTWDFIDIVQVKVENLDEDTATFIVEVNGDAEAAEIPWFIYIWSACEDSDAEYYMIGIFYGEGIGGEEINIYAGIQGDENITGEMDFNEAGTEIEMDFPSDWWEDSEDCDVRVMTVTMENEDDGENSNIVLDLYPCGTSEIWDWIWLILLLILLIAIIALVYYLYKRRQKKTHPSNKPRLKGGK